MTELAYKPFEKVKKSDVQEISIPPYEDKGIKYQGYSKTLKNGNTYQLNYQEPIDINTEGVSTAGGEDYFLYTRPNQATKDFYCTDIVFINSWNTHAYPSKVEIMDQTTARVRLYEDFSKKHEVFVLHFEVPIKFSKGNGIYTHFTVGRTITDRFSLNMYGWEE
jgi:hypothetical protein